MTTISVTREVTAEADRDPVIELSVVASLALPLLVAELVDIVDGAAVLDQRHRHKLPDWSYDAVYSGKVPAESLPGTPAPWRT